MTDERLPDGPDLAQMLQLIRDAYPDAVGVYRINVGVDRETFQRLVGSMIDPDHAALDRFVPHPVYAKQRWISVLNPTHATLRDRLMPLIAEAHDRLVAQRKRAR